MKGNNTVRLFDAAIDYRVVAMRPEREDDARTLREALSQGVVAQRDPDRGGFYSVALDGRAFYIHVHEAAKTIYILRTALGRPENAVRSHSQTGQTTADCLA